jgi:hypothetical protein
MKRPTASLGLVMREKSETVVKVHIDGLVRRCVIGHSDGGQPGLPRAVQSGNASVRTYEVTLSEMIESVCNCGSCGLVRRVQGPVMPAVMSRNR